ncbi:DUF1501 domain-containing protein [Vibrio lentus]|nr:DUF1501 domain-containing protein [Vibrio lentus]
MGKTGDILSADNGPNIATLELGGWTCSRQSQGNINGRLSNQLKILDVGLAALKASLGDRWQKTVIIAASEFRVEQQKKMVLKAPTMAQTSCWFLVERCHR